MTQVQLKPYLEIYDYLIKRLQNVKKRYWVITTYPYQPKKGEHPSRDKFYEFHEQFVQKNKNIDIIRIVTITHISKYHWVNALIEKFRKHPKYNLGYIEIGENTLPFLGIMVFDDEEVILTAVTEPKDQAYFLVHNDKESIDFFEHYIERSWNQSCIKLKEKDTIYRRNLESLHDSLKKPIITPIELNKKHGKWIKVSIVQFYLNNYLCTDKGLTKLNKLGSKELKNKTIRILDFLAEKNIDIVVFPELSISKEYVQIFQKISHSNNMIIIGGSYYDNTTRKNISPIVIGKNIYNTEKIHLSPYQKSPHKDKGAIEGNQMYIFSNSIVGNFGVVICMDYLDNMVVNEIYTRCDIDFLIVVSMNNNSERFFKKMQWECEFNPNGVYILYSNSFFTKNDNIISDGKSSIWGLLDKRYLSEDQKDFTHQQAIISNMKEGIIIGEFNIENKKPFIKTVPDEPNIKEIELYSFDQLTLDKEK